VSSVNVCGCVGRKGHHALVQSPSERNMQAMQAARAEWEARRGMHEWLGEKEGDGVGARRGVEVCTVATSNATQQVIWS
jgi:hypothetical protein